MDPSSRALAGQTAGAVRLGCPGTHTHAHRASAELGQVMSILQVPGALHGPLIPGARLPDRRKGVAAGLQRIQGSADAAVVCVDGCVGAQQQAVWVIAG